MPVGKDTERLNVYISKPLKKRLEAFTEENGVSMSKTINNALEAFFSESSDFDEALSVLLKNQQKQLNENIQVLSELKKRKRRK